MLSPDFSQKSPLPLLTLSSGTHSKVRLNRCGRARRRRKPSRGAPFDPCPSEACFRTGRRFSVHRDVAGVAAKSRRPSTTTGHSAASRSHATAACDRRGLRQRPPQQRRPEHAAIKKTQSARDSRAWRGAAAVEVVADRQRRRRRQQRPFIFPHDTHFTVVVIRFACVASNFYAAHPPLHVRAPRKRRTRRHVAAATNQQPHEPAAQQPVQTASVNRERRLCVIQPFRDEKRAKITKCPIPSPDLALDFQPLEECFPNFDKIRKQKFFLPLSEPEIRPNSRECSVSATRKSPPLKPFMRFDTFHRYSPVGA